MYIVHWTLYIVQALAADKLYPKIEFFAKGYGPGRSICVYLLAAMMSCVRVLLLILYTMSGLKILIVHYCHCHQILPTEAMILSKDPSIYVCRIEISKTQVMIPSEDTFLSSASLLAASSLAISMLSGRSSPSSSPSSSSSSLGQSRLTAGKA